MIDKILVGIGLVITVILLIENIIVSESGFLYVFIWEVSGPMLVIVSIIIGIIIGFGLHGIINSKNDYSNDDSNF